MIAALLFGRDVVNVIECESLPTVRRDSGFDSARDVTDCATMPNVGDTYDPDAECFIGRAAVLSRAAATKRINDECGAFRAQFVTDITGQETVYQYKSDECDAWDAMVANGDDPLQSLASFPLIAGEATVRGISPSAMRDLIYTTRNAWRTMANHSDLKRQAMHQALAECSTAAEIAALFPINWGAL